MAFSKNTKTAGPSFENILRDVKAGQLKPIYYLMGEEGYFIDRLSAAVVDAALTEDQKAFGLLNLFGGETNIDQIVGAAMGFPMGAPRQVIVVHEAQALRSLTELALYLKSPNPMTVLVFCHRNGRLDGRTEVAKLVQKVGVLFDSVKLRDTQLPAFVKNYLKERGLDIDTDAAAMMSDYVGADLTRMAGELDKICLVMNQEGGQRVGRGKVAELIGVSKEYNYFELQDALTQKNVAKATKIVDYFARNPREMPLPLFLGSLFRLFSQLMMAYYAPDRSARGIAQWLGANEWAVTKNIMPAMRNYSGVKVMNIIGAIRRTDARSKGLDTGPSVTPTDLMQELIFYILH